MALTILQQPNLYDGYFNVSNTNLIYTISSSNVPQFQYRYIADLYLSGSATKLARFKYPQNSSNTANIDLGRPIGDYLGTNYSWKADIVDISSETSNVFTVKFGEEYGTSYTSPVTEFANEVTASIQVLNGNIQYPALGEYSKTTNVRTDAVSSINFNANAYTLNNSSIGADGAARFGDQTLSNNPNMLTQPSTAKRMVPQTFSLSYQAYPKELYDNASLKGFYVAQGIGNDDYATETYIDTTPFNNTGVTVYFSLFDDNNTLIWESNTCSEGNVVAKYNPVVDNLGDEPPGTLAVGVGLPNLAACLNNTDLTGSLGTGPLSASISSSAQWNWYQIGVYADNYRSTWSAHWYYNEDKGPDNLLSFTSGTGSISPNGAFTEFALPIRPGMWANKYYPTYCNNEKTRFAFINSFGVWDYYNVYMPTRRVTNVDRKTYTQPYLNYDERITSYNVSNRGNTQYYTEYTDQFEITTDMLDSQESQWLREMFESDDVYIQSGSDFIPIIINNTQEQISNNKYRNKNFRYTVRYQFSNLREPR